MANDTEIGGLVVKVKSDLSDYRKGMDTVGPSAQKEAKKVIDSFNKMGTDVGKAADKFGKELDDIEKSTQNTVTDVRTEVAKIPKAFDNMAAGVDKASDRYNKKLADMDKKLEETRKKAGSERLQTAADVVEGAGATLSGLGAISLKVAADAVESENLFEESFEGMSDAARSWSVNLRNELGLNEYELRKNSGMLYVMMGSMGLAKDAAYDMSTSLTKLSEDMASFYNLSSADAFEKIRSGLTGEAEPLKALGILVDETTVKNYAYATGIAQVGDELTQQQKVLARYQAIMIQTSKAQGDLGRTLDSPTNQMRIARNDAEMLAVKLGQSLIPEYMRVIGTARNTMSAFQGLSEETQNTAKRIAVVAIEAGAAVTAVRMLGLAVGASVNPWVTLAVAITAATASLAGFLRLKKEQEENNASEAITGFKPSKDIAKVRLNERTGFYEKEVEDTGLFGEKINRWQKVEGQELDSLVYQNRRLSKGDSVGGSQDTSAEAAAEAERKRIQALIDAANAAGSTSSSSGSKQTELQQYEAVTQKLVSIAQDQVELDQLSREQFRDLLRERLTGLNEVSATDDEILDKKKAQMTLEKQIHDVEKQIAQDTVEMASQRVQLGQMSLDQYIKMLERQKDLAKTERERLDLAVKIAVENAKILAIQLQAIERQSEKDKQALTLEQENARHRLAMQKIVSPQKKSWAEEDYNLALKNLDAQVAKERKTADEKIQIYKEIKNTVGTLTAEENKAYQQAIQDKEDIDAKYRQAKLELDNEYAEAAAAYQQSIIDANNDMIADLITGTRSGHDILKQMWVDFVRQVVDEMFSIKSEMNIFTELLGGIFGIGGSSKETDSGFSFESFWGTMTGARAAGGPVQAGKAYMVGEGKKPEIFVPGQNGSIIPNSDIVSQLGGNRNIQAEAQPIYQVSINPSFQSFDPATGQEMFQKNIPMLLGEVENALRNKTSMRNAAKSAAR